jgi:hypothetical protein
VAGTTGLAMAVPADRGEDAWEGWETRMPAAVVKARIAIACGEDDLRYFPAGTGMRVGGVVVSLT